LIFNNAKEIVLCVDACAENLNAAQWMKRIVSAMNQPFAEIKKDHGKRTVKTILEPFGMVCLQELTFSSKRKILSLIRPVQGIGIWNFAKKLRRDGIGFTEPLLLMVQKKGLFVSRTFNVSRWVEGRNLNHLVLESLENAAPIPEKSIIAAADAVIRLHRSGYIHGDLKWSNFICMGKHFCEIRLSDLGHLRKTFLPGSCAKDFARFVLAACEYGLPEDFSKLLIERYLDKNRNNMYWAGMILRWEIKRKMGRYKNRYTRNFHST
jgi:tRNA A-37 threonylcarbamoyl transferase component Bud32